MAEQLIGMQAQMQKSIEKFIQRSIRAEDAFNFKIKEMIGSVKKIQAQNLSIAADLTLPQLKPK